jgi:hypothetical protein
MAGEDVASGRASAPGKQLESKLKLRIEVTLDPRRATSYHRYTIACQHFLKNKFPAVQTSAQGQLTLPETAPLRLD